MKNSLAAGALLLAGFLLGVVALQTAHETNPDVRSVEVPEIVFPSAALKQWFPPVSEYDTGGQPLDDESFGALMTALDEALNAGETLSDFGQEGDIHLWNFVRRLMRPRITEAQSERIAAYMEELQARHPDHSDAIAHHAGSLAILYADAVPSVPPFSWGPGTFQHAASTFDSIVGRRGLYRRSCRRVACLDPYRLDHARNRERLRPGGRPLFRRVGSHPPAGGAYRAAKRSRVHVAGRDEGIERAVHRYDGTGTGQAAQFHSGGNPAEHRGE